MTLTATRDDGSYCGHPVEDFDQALTVFERLSVLNLDGWTWTVEP